VYTDLTAVVSSEVRGRRIALHMMLQPLLGSIFVAVCVFDEAKGEWTHEFKGRSGLFDLAFEMEKITAAGGLKSWLLQLIDFVNETMGAWFNDASAPPPPPIGDPTTIDELRVYLAARLDIADTPTAPVLKLKDQT
jgi:hypothetical protein